MWWRLFDARDFFFCRGFVSGHASRQLFFLGYEKVGHKGRKRRETEGKRGQLKNRFLLFIVSPRCVSLFNCHCGSVLNFKLLYCSLDALSRTMCFVLAHGGGVIVAMIARALFSRYIVSGTRVLNRLVDHTRVCTGADSLLNAP